MNLNTEKTNPKSQNIELGKVTWFRDYNYALHLSSKLSKPILLFFQEIPGCSTCVNFGREVLSHPIMVDIIENEFIPLAIYNNKPGIDADILKRYDEPAWNNPVAHFVDQNGKDIVQKLANNYHPLSMLDKIIEALRGIKVEIPEYILNFRKELQIHYGFTKTTIYETPCFWSGETSFALNDAVYSTMAGFIGHKEVVKLEYDPTKTILEELNEYALAQGFFLVENHKPFRIDKDPQYYLKKTNFKFLPLTLAQRTAINLALPYKKDAKKYLSPTQLMWYNHNKLSELSHPKAYELNIVQSWNFLTNQIK